MLTLQSRLSSAKWARCWKELAPRFFSPDYHWRRETQQRAAASLQLNGNDPPWKLRFGEEFGGMKVEFGAKILFDNNPARPDNSARKMSLQQQMMTCSCVTTSNQDINGRGSISLRSLMPWITMPEMAALLFSVLARSLFRPVVLRFHFVQLKRPKSPKPSVLRILSLQMLTARSSRKFLMQPKHCPSGPDVGAFTRELEAVELTDQPNRIPAGDPISDNVQWDGVRLVRARKAQPDFQTFHQIFGSKWDRKSKQKKKGEKNDSSPPKVPQVDQSQARPSRQKTLLPSRHATPLQHVEKALGK